MANFELKYLPSDDLLQTLAFFSRFDLIQLQQAHPLLHTFVEEHFGHGRPPYIGCALTIWSDGWLGMAAFRQNWQRHMEQHVEATRADQRECRETFKYVWRFVDDEKESEDATAHNILTTTDSSVPARKIVQLFENSAHQNCNNAADWKLWEEWRVAPISAEEDKSPFYHWQHWLHRGHLTDDWDQHRQEPACSCFRNMDLWRTKMLADWLYNHRFCPETKPPFEDAANNNNNYCTLIPFPLVSLHQQQGGGGEKPPSSCADNDDGVEQMLRHFDEKFVRLLDVRFIAPGSSLFSVGCKNDAEKLVAFEQSRAATNDPKICHKICQFLQQLFTLDNELLLSNVDIRIMQWTTLVKQLKLANLDFIRRAELLAKMAKKCAKLRVEQKSAASTAGGEWESEDGFRQLTEGRLLCAKHVELGFFAAYSAANWVALIHAQNPTSPSVVEHMPFNEREIFLYFEPALLPGILGQLVEHFQDATSLCDRRPYMFTYKLLTDTKIWNGKRLSNDIPNEYHWCDYAEMDKFLPDCLRPTRVGGSTLWRPDILLCNQNSGELWRLIRRPLLRQPVCQHWALIVARYSLECQPDFHRQCEAIVEELLCWRQKCLELEDALLNNAEHQPATSSTPIGLTGRIYYDPLWLYCAPRCGIEVQRSCAK